jgi:hypothetical protein
MEGQNSAADDKENSTSDVDIVERKVTAYLLTNSISKIINATHIVIENEPDFESSTKVKRDATKKLFWSKSFKLFDAFFKMKTDDYSENDTQTGPFSST